VAVDAAGRVYVVDRENNRVQEFSANGGFLAAWGLRGVGPGEFELPTAIAVDCHGDVYVADTHNNRVQRFNPVGPAESGCLPISAWPPPLDVPPVLHVSLAGAHGILAHRALSLAVGCQRACKVLLSALLSAAGKRPLPLVAAARTLPAAQTSRIRLFVGPRTLRGLRRELGRRRRLTATVKVVAAGPTGRRTVLTRAFAVTR
jgi:hypothetical protein